MISFELDNSQLGIEIVVDAEGVNELIKYLQFIRDKKDHIHLLVGNELSGDVTHEGNQTITHAKLVYLTRGEQ